MKFILLWSKWFELKLDLSFSPQLIFTRKKCVGPGPSLDMCTSAYAKSISWGWLMKLTTLLWPWPNFGYCVLWLMAKPWVEGDYYDECSWKWGWKNKERERTKLKLLKNQLKEKKRKGKYTRNTSKKRRESLTQMKKEEKIARWKNMRNRAR